MKRGGEVRFRDGDGREPTEGRLKRQERIDFISFLKRRKVEGEKGEVSDGCLCSCMHRFGGAADEW